MKGLFLNVYFPIVCGEMLKMWQKWYKKYFGISSFLCLYNFIIKLNFLDTSVDNKPNKSGFFCYDAH